jgi:hypothetical protein
MLKTPNYVCKYGLYHDKEVLDSDPSSNNGWIYTAYAKFLVKIPFSKKQISEYSGCFIECFSNFTRDREKPTRLPGKLTPPMSRDEIIGVVCLDLLSPHALKPVNYRYYRSDIKFNLFKSLKSIYKLRYSV